MEFGSKFVYNYSEEEQDSYDEEDIEAQLDEAPKARDETKKRRKWRKADTNVLSVKFNHLTSASDMHTGDPTYCTGCGAIVSCISNIQNQSWKCEFCDTANTIDVLPEKNDVTYMIQPAVTSAATHRVAKKLAPDGEESLVVFCIDISGSMSCEAKIPVCDDISQTPHQLSYDVTSISRLDAVKVAVTRQIQELSETSPHTRVALITFENKVCAIGDGSSIRPLKFDGNKKSAEKLKTLGRKLPLPKPVIKTKAKLTDKVCGLKTRNLTALGPALLLSVAMATKVRGSKVIICTDGEANVGLGKLDSRGGNAYDEATEFYTDTANYASQNGVSISVITFEGTDCRLAELGHVAAITEGHVNIVDPMKLTEEFGNILIDRTIATNVTATFIIHQGMYFRNEENVESKVVKEYGNVSRDTEITFEYGFRMDKKKPPATTSSEQDSLSQAAAEPRKPDVASTSTAEPRAEANTSTELAAEANTSTEPAAGANTSTEPPAEANTSTEPAAEANKSTEPAAEANTSTETGAEANTSTEPAAEANTSTGLAVEANTSTEPAVEPNTTTESNKTPEQAELPFQLQIIYTDMKGSRAMRVLTKKKPVTKDREKAESNMRAHVMATHGTQLNAQYALGGNYKAARMNAKSNFMLLNRNQHQQQVQEMQEAYLERNLPIYNAVNDYEQHEKQQYGRTLSESDDSDEDDTAPTGMKPKSKKKHVFQQRQQMRQDKTSKNMFSQLKARFKPSADDDDD